MSRSHHELPGQLTLDGLDASPARVQATGPARQSVRSIGWARCLHGRHPQLTGVIYHGDQLVFRDHIVRLGPSRVPLTCPGSGRRLPDGHAMYERQDDECLTR
jgi:hypothetical protein